MEKKFISGIHNYCDRWCERCEFTMRCAIYDPKMEILARSDNPEDQKKVWKKIEENYRTIAEMLHREFEKRGLDINEIYDSEYIDKSKEIEEQIINHYIKTEYKKYVSTYREWYKNNHEHLKEIIDDFNYKLEVGLDEVDSINHLLTLEDAIEVIQFYLYFIEAKLTRALSSHLDPILTDDFYEEEGFQKDSEGSAKIALIALDRTIAAWLTIHKYLNKDDDDEIIQFMMKLDKIRSVTEEILPKARDFVRPGFDTGESPYFDGE